MNDVKDKQYSEKEYSETYEINVEEDKRESKDSKSSKETNEFKIMGIGNWIITFIILSIPIVNFIMLVVWSFGGVNIPVYKKNFARAAIIFGIISLLFSIVLFLMLGAVGVGFLQIF